MSIEELKIRYISLRTHFTKLKKKKSDEGAPEYSERKTSGCWTTSSFWPPFTYEGTKRTLVSEVYITIITLALKGLLHSIGNLYWFLRTLGIG